MSDSKKKTAVFPGTFDPITNGHLDVIQRGAKLFDEIIIAVGENPDKTCLFTQDERTEIITRVVADMENVKVQSYSGLTVDFVNQNRANIILKGIRNLSDLAHESQMALTNRAVAGVETVFIMTKPEYSFISSTLVKQLAQGGGDICSLVPPATVPSILSKVAPK